MTLQIYNTMTRTKEEFVPQEPGKVKCMYADRPCTTTFISVMHVR